MSAGLLLAARRDPTRKVTHLPDPPQDEAAAYAIQREIMATLGPIGAWKVGSPHPAGGFTCAPLPASGVQDSPGHVLTDQCTDQGVEAEICVRLAHDLPPRDPPYGAQDILAAIASAHPAIEVLQSRFVDVDKVDPLSNLADSLSHFGLVVGPAIPDWRTIDLAVEQVGLVVNGTEVKRRTGNPAGDMVRLLVWLANTGAVWAGGLQAGQYVTTGSWTAKDFVPPGAAVRVVFDHAGSVELQFSA